MNGRSRAPAPKAILVTGDIAFSGKEEQYQKAASWLEKVAGAVGLRRSDVYLVPGNHDIDRAADSARATQRLLQSLRDPRDDRDDLDEALKDKGDRETLLGRMEAYLTFAKGFASPAEPYWSLTRDLISGIP